jgi:hypothetical protein
MTQLLDWLEGRLPEDEAAAISAAVQADDSYQATLTWLQSFLNFSRSTVMIEPPPDLLQEATSRFRAFAQGKRPAQWLQRLVATLASDSWQRPSLVGVRRTGLNVMPRQLVYQTNTADIALNIQARTDKNVFDLFGQVFSTDGSRPDSFTIQLTLHSQELEVAVAYTNTVGKFSFTDLAAGRYSIIIRGDRVEITVANVDLSG